MRRPARAVRRLAGPALLAVAALATWRALALRSSGSGTVAWATVDAVATRGDATARPAADAAGGVGSGAPRPGAAAVSTPHTRPGRGPTRSTTATSNSHTVLRPPASAPAGAAAAAAAATTAAAAAALPAPLSRLPLRPSPRPPPPPSPPRAVPSASSVPPRSLRIAVYEDNNFHTEVLGVLLDWARARNHTAALFVADQSSFRSFVPMYKRLFPRTSVHAPRSFAARAGEFDLIFIGTATPHKHVRLPPPVAAALAARPERAVYIAHHVDAASDVLYASQRRLLSLTPLMARPYLTPFFRQGDGAWGPRLGLRDRHRAVCMIGSGASGRYRVADIDAFVAAQLEVAAAAGTAWAPVDAPPPPAGSFILGAGAAAKLAAPAAPSTAQGGGAAAMPPSPPPPLLRFTSADGGVVWEPATLRWWWRGVAAGAAVAPWRVQRFRRTTEMAFNRGDAPALPLAALRSDNETVAAAAVQAVLGVRAKRLLNDARPASAVAAVLSDFDSYHAVGAIRRCAFVLVHPLPSAREMRSRMTGALPTALIARTPLLAPRAFTDIYDLTAASLTFNESLAEVAGALAAMTDERYDALLDALDVARARLQGRANALLDRFAAEPAWGGVDELGPGWDLRVPGAGGPLALVAAAREQRGLAPLPPPSQASLPSPSGTAPEAAGASPPAPPPAPGGDRREEPRRRGAERAVGGSDGRSGGGGSRGTEWGRHPRGDSAAGAPRQRQKRRRRERRAGGGGGGDHEP